MEGWVRTNLYRTRSYYQHRVAKQLSFILLVFIFVFSWASTSLGLLFSESHALDNSWVTSDGAGNHSWRSVVISADGQTLAASYQGYIYTSTDRGTTWIQRTSAGNRFWISMAISANGQIIIAAATNGEYIYTSSDGGATWLERTNAGARQWQGVAISANGTKMVAASGWYGHGYIYTSTDGGSTWTERTSSGDNYWRAVTSSSDGSKLAAVVELDNAGSGRYIYTSTDSGATWTKRTSAGDRFWSGIASSSDGMKLAATTGTFAGDPNYYIYTSTDGGATWTERTSAGDVPRNDIASTADGQTLIVSNNLRVAQVSTDGGATWQDETVTLNRVAVSASGTRFIGADSTGLITLNFPEPAGEPRPISATAGNKSATITWQHPLDVSTPVSNYEIQYKKIGDASWTVASNNISNAMTTYKVNNLTPNQTYDFRIRSLSLEGPSAWVTMVLIAKDLPDVGGVILQSNLADVMDISNDGQSIIVSMADGYLYVSNDGGDTWSSKDALGSDLRYYVSVSGNGQKYVIASVDNDGGIGSIQTSDDGGETWVVRTAAGENIWTGIAQSFDGSTIYISGASESFDFLLKKSTDGGATWTDIVPHPTLLPFALDYDQSTGKLYAAAVNLFGGGSDLMVTSNDGNAWNVLNHSDSDTFTGISVLEGGKEIVSSTYESSGNGRMHILTSNDYGATWQSGEAIARANFRQLSGGYYAYITDTSFVKFNPSALVATPTGEIDATPPPSENGTPNPIPNTPTQPKTENQTSSEGAESPNSSQTTSLSVDGVTIKDGQVVNESPTFSGYANPFDEIEITIHSDPIVCSTTADATGYWECTLSAELPAGEHTVLVKVTSHADGSVKEYGPYAVNVADSTEPPTVIDSNDQKVAETSAKNESNLSLLVAIIGGGLAVLIIIILALSAKRRKSQ